jgi:NAD(P)-dependent dehydrogenase (short-subunit alcohol dehydrogenase family)
VSADAELAQRARAYEPPPGLLEGRAILVTGAGQGLGRAVALACARSGATVALLGRKVEKLEATYDAIVASSAPDPAMVPLDLAAADGGALDNLAQLLRRSLKRLDGIVHCASHFVPLAPLANQTLEQWLQLLRVNLAVPFALTRACLPLLRASGEASVVFTGETHGAHPRAYWGGFAVGKSALATLAAVWADELERGVRMNVLIPGPIASPQRAQSHPGEDRAQLPAPEDVANAFLFLLGRDSRETTGKTVEL